MPSLSKSVGLLFVSTKILFATQMYHWSSNESIILAVPVE